MAAIGATSIGHQMPQHADGEDDWPRAHKHRVVTQLMLLVDGRPQHVDFSDLFTANATFEDPIGIVHGRQQIEQAWQIRAQTWKPEVPHDVPHEGGRSRGESTVMLSVQPQSENEARIELKKRYVVRGQSGSSFELDTCLFAQLDPQGKIAVLEDKWNESLVVSSYFYH